MAKEKTIIIIGAGAAGFFCAINLAEKNPRYKISILERSNKVLTKVKISGGGRCNITNNEQEISEIIKNYPRGEKELRQVFQRFSVRDTINWFESKGVTLKTESDGRIFPTSDTSQTIIDCFLREAKKHNIEIKTNEEVLSIKKTELNIFKIITSKNNLIADKIVCSAGGFNNKEKYNFISNLGHKIIEPVPSLFTLNISKNNITSLGGIAVKNAKIKICNTKLETTGIILITHWGFSGPAVLKLSAFAARELNKLKYNCKIQINWCGSLKIDAAIKILKDAKSSKSKFVNNSQFEIPNRLWGHLVLKTGIAENKTGPDISNNDIQKLATLLLSDIYFVNGKSTFKEEFVTAGGVNKKEIDFKTMESRIIKGLYFAGEFIDIDGVTGGFNFQNAWSTAWIVAENC